MAVDDSYTKLLLHMDTSSFIDEAGNAVTKSGTVSLGSGKFSNSGYWDSITGTSYLNISDSIDWQLDNGTSDNWTIDFWFRWDDYNGNGDPAFMGQHVDANNFWRLMYNGTTGGIQFRIKSGGVNIVDINKTYSLVPNTYVHIAVVKSGNDYKVYINGIQIGTTATDSDRMPNFAAPLRIGYCQSGPYFMDGDLDEIRISKGIARWTSNFTPPSAAYGPGGLKFRRMVDGVGRIGVRSAR